MNRNLSATPIAAIKDGDKVRIIGRTGQRDELLTSPVSRRGCIGFVLVVDKLRKTPFRDQWVRIVNQQQFMQFSLTDDTGQAIVDGPFTIGLNPDESSWTTMPVWVYVLLQEQGLSLAGSFGGDDQLRYSETVLLVGDRVAAFGRVALEIDPAGRSGPSREPPMLYHLRGSDADPVVITDIEMQPTSTG